MALPYPLSNPDPVQPTPFRPDRMSRLSEIEAWHFWFAGRRALVDKILAAYVRHKAPNLIDLGCGTGFTLASIQRPGWKLSGFELLPEGLSRAHKLYPQLQLGRASVEALPLAADSCEIVLLLDVL